MSDTRSDDDDDRPEARQRLLHGRSFGPLLTPFISCAIVATLIYLFERAMPAFHEVVKIAYFAIAVVFVISTGRALRTREGRRRMEERRYGDRRQSRRE
jgi:hypothetical protein